MATITSKHFELINEFIPYFNSFYGVEGIYSHGRDYTSAEILKAMCVLFTQRPEHKFEGDSFDRELIRDIMLEHFNTKAA